MTMLWTVETSHLIAVPVMYEAKDLEDLFQQLQAQADNKRTNGLQPPIGSLTFKTTLDADQQPCLIRVSFIGRDNSPRRFMRLRREYRREAA